jgi:hypothetical protein
MTRRTLLATAAAALVAVAPAAGAFTASARNDAGRAAAAAIFKPRSTGAPAVTGPTRVGETLTGDDGTWERRPASFAYVWLRCDAAGTACQEIPGANARTYLLTAADLDRRVRLQVTGRNDGGAAVATSLPTEAVMAPAVRNPPSQKALPSVGGSLLVDELLRIDEGAWDGAPTRFEFQWQRCASTGTACTDLPQETGRYYRVDSSDVGLSLRAIVVAFNDGGSSSPARTALTAPVSRRAFTYVVCADPETGLGVGPGGASAPPGFSIAFYGDELSTSNTRRCDAGTTKPELSTSITGGRTLTPYAGPRWRYDVPAGLTLLGGYLFRASSFTSPFGTSWTRTPGGSPNDTPHDACWHHLGCYGQGSAADRFGAGNRVPLLTTMSTGFGYTLHCHTNGVLCQGTGWHAIYGGRLVLRDDSTPSLAAPATGSLVTGTALGASAAVALEARDSGSGLYRVRVRVDDVDVAARIVDPNGGRCADANAGNSDPYEFATHTPCAASFGGSITFDTTSWPDGVHRLQAILEDAGGNALTLSKRTVTIGP